MKLRKKEGLKFEEVVDLVVRRKVKGPKIGRPDPTEC